MEIEYKTKIGNIKFNSKDINGIIGNKLSDIEEIIKVDYESIDKIILDKKTLSKEDYNTLKRKISIVKKNDYLNIQIGTINELMEYILKQKKIYPKNKQKKINDSLRIVGLDKSILERNIKNISRSETKLLQIAISLLSNPDILVIEEPFNYLDLKSIKNIMIVLRKVKEQYNKVIIFVSDDIEKMYQHTDKIVIYNSKEIILIGDTKKVFQDVKKLKEYDIPIPHIVEFTYQAKKEKKVKIDYHSDIRDIIKDIYKHV